MLFVEFVVCLSPKTGNRGEISGGIFTKSGNQTGICSEMSGDHLF